MNEKAKVESLTDGKHPTGLIPWVTLSNTSQQRLWLTPVWLHFCVLAFFPGTRIQLFFSQIHTLLETESHPWWTLKEKQTEHTWRAGSIISSSHNKQEHYTSRTEQYVPHRMLTTIHLRSWLDLHGTRFPQDSNALKLTILHTCSVLSLILEFKVFWIVLGND